MNTQANPGLPHPQSGFTLIELVTVMAIIGVLMAILLPAVQMARESARRMQCKNNLKQLTLAAIEHEALYGWYPTGGWSKRWIGLPDRGAGPHQPGGWAYNILPFLEQTNLHQLGGSDSNSDEQMQQNADRLQTAVSVFHCPSRRPGQAFTNTRTYLLARPVTSVARNDYAFNGGHRVVLSGHGPDSLHEEEWFDWPDTSSATGISFQKSQVRHRDVVDGTSNTYMVAEKHLRRDRYATGDDLGDNEAVFSGDDRDLLRFTGGEVDHSFRPLSDATASSREGLVFGSVHTLGFHAGFCDGSVRFTQYGLSQKIHSRLGNRRDNRVVND